MMGNPLAATDVCTMDRCEQFPERVASSRMLDTVTGSVAGSLEDPKTVRCLVVTFVSEWMCQTPGTDDW